MDRALLKIGQAKWRPARPREAITIFNALLALPKSELKAESQFSIAAALENEAIKAAEGRGQEPAWRR